MEKLNNIGEQLGDLAKTKIILKGRQRKIQ